MQNEQFKQRVEPRKALELALNMEFRMLNQHQIKTYNKTLILASVNTHNNHQKNNHHNTQSVLAPIIVPSQTISTENACDHHNSTAPNVGTMDSFRSR